jgi:hypothetical protein
VFNILHFRIFFTSVGNNSISVRPSSRNRKKIFKFVKKKEKGITNMGNNKKIKLKKQQKYHVSEARNDIENSKCHFLRVLSRHSKIKLD